MKVLLISSPVGPLGSGSIGGVGRTVESTLAALALKGHRAEIFAPHGSETAEFEVQAEGAQRAKRAEMRGFSGRLQPTAATAEPRATYPIPADGVLASMWHTAFEEQSRFDVILNLAHDWLPYYLSAFFETPVIHLANLPHVDEPTTAEMVRYASDHPKRVAVISAAHRDSLPGLVDPPILSFGLDLAAYPFNPRAQGAIVWAGRISPEKGLEDALAIASRAGEPLCVAGAIEDQAYFDRLGVADYRGYLSQDSLQRLLGEARVLLSTPKWEEAFGIVTVEAMACGTPVIAYDRGANRELVRDGENGFLIARDDVAAAADAVRRIDTIDRAACRRSAEARFSLAAYADRVDAWLRSIA